MGLSLDEGERRGFEGCLCGWEGMRMHVLAF